MFVPFSLPKSIQRRVKALKKLQFESTKIEAEFYKEVHELECKYAARYDNVFQKVSYVAPVDPLPQTHGER